MLNYNRKLEILTKALEKIACADKIVNGDCVDIAQKALLKIKDR